MQKAVGFEKMVFCFFATNKQDHGVCAGFSHTVRGSLPLSLFWPCPHSPPPPNQHRPPTLSSFVVKAAQRQAERLDGGFKAPQLRGGKLHAHAELAARRARGN